MSEQIGRDYCQDYDPELLRFCNTENQREIYAAYGETGSVNATAKKTGKDSGTVSKLIRAVQARAGRAGYSSMIDATRHIPSSESVKGRSILTKDDDGNAIWIKTEKSQEEQKKAFAEYIKGLTQDIKPAKKSAAAKGKHASDLMSAIFIGDAHIGMYAWGTETKHSDFNTDIAAQGLRDAIDDLIERSPQAETLLLVDVGDFMHANSSHAKTWKGTDVDVDTRYSRVLRTAGTVMNYAVSQALKKFKKVVVVIARGNHNEDPAVAVQEITKAWWRNEPRVDVLDTDGRFHYLEWGNWLIGVNHGDKLKPQKLVNVMARDQAAAWGRTSHRMWACGHFHHEQVMEMDGCTVHRFGALPPPDAWHASMGYGGDGQMQMMVFKKGGGKHSTLIYDLPAPVHAPDRRIA